MTDYPVPDSVPGTAPQRAEPFEDPIPTLLDPAELSAARTPSVAPCAVLPVVPGYAIRDLLGHGGMGIVFRAQHLQLGRQVALKMIRDGLLATPAHVARFQAEARAVARLQHPHIVQIFEIGEHQGRPYFALELVEGENLSQRLARSAMQPREAAALVELLARAIHHAHRQGIVHRDLKPANILLTAEGAPKIADFGLAKELEAELFLSHGSSNTLLGTPSYMAPEQAWGPPEAVGPAADVYSLGAILYECLTGKPPFLAGSLLEVLDQLRHRDPIPPRQLNPEVPRDLETICLKCLGKMPGHRYASADELAEDLRRFQADEPIRARRISPLERVWKGVSRRPAVSLMAALLCFTLCMAALGAWYANRWAQHQQDAARADLQRARYPALLQQAQQAIAQHRLAVARQILDECPDDVRGWEWELLSDLADGHTAPRLGRLRNPVPALAFDPVRGHLYAAADSGMRVWNQQTLEELSPLPVQGRVRGLTISPDGRHLAALVETAQQPNPARLIQPLPLHWFSAIPSAARSAHALLEPPLSPLLTTEPAAPLVLVVPRRSEEVQVWDLRTRQPVLRWVGPADAGPLVTHRLAFSPQGEQLAVLTTAAAFIRSAPPATSRNTLPREGLTDRLACCAEVVPAPLADQPIPVPARSSLALFDLSKPTHPPRTVRLDGAECHSLAYAPDGTTLALGSTGGQIRLLDPSTGQSHGELRGPEGGTLVSLAFDRGGTRLAAGTAEGHVDLWNMNAGELLHMLPGHAGPVSQLHFDSRSARLCTLGQDGYLRVWHTATGQGLLTTRVAPGPYLPAMSRAGTGSLVAVANSAEGGHNHGITLLGSRARGKPAPWQTRPAEPLGVAQRKVFFCPDEPPHSAEPPLRVVQ